MVELDEVFSEKIKHGGIFDFKEWYTFSYTWLNDKDYFVKEREYSEKINPDGKEIKIRWEATKKISDYFRFKLKIEWYIRGLKDVEVVKNGAKVKMNTGSPEIKVTAILEKDYENRWENSGFLKFLRGLYDMYIIRGRIDQYEENLKEEADEFIAWTKSYLALTGKQ